MADTEEDKKDGKKKKGGLGKILILAVVGLLVVGGAVAGGVYAASSGMFGGGHATEAADADQPRLLPKSEEKRATAGGEGGEGGHGEGGEAAASGGHGMPTPAGSGGDKYASTYYQMDKEFTSNLQDSVHFIQVGVAISTPYDERVVENLKTHEIAVRSAILLALGETGEEQVFTAEGKRQLQTRLVNAINGVLKQKEGFGGIGNVYFTNFIVQ